MRKAGLGSRKGGILSFDLCAFSANLKHWKSKIFFVRPNYNGPSFTTTMKGSICWRMSLRFCSKSRGFTRLICEKYFKVFKILFKDIEGYFMHFMGVGDSTTGESKIQPFSYCRQISLKSLKTSEDQLQNPRNPWKYGVEIPWNPWKLVKNDPWNPWICTERSAGHHEDSQAKF